MFKCRESRAFKKWCSYLLAGRASEPSSIVDFVTGGGAGG